MIYYFKVKQKHINEGQRPFGHFDWDKGLFRGNSCPVARAIKDTFKEKLIRVSNNGFATFKGTKDEGSYGGFVVYLSNAALAFVREADDIRSSEHPFNLEPGIFFISSPDRALSYRSRKLTKEIEWLNVAGGDVSSVAPD